MRNISKSAISKKILCSNTVLLNSIGLILRESRLGWIVSGSLLAPDSENENVQYQLEKFWQVEEISKPEFGSYDACEHYFRQTTLKGDDGKFIVKYPLSKPVSELSDTRAVALKRFQSLERKFATNEKFRIMYSEFMREYIDLGHMSLVTTPLDNAHYLPHHGVLREDSTTTKLRVVFDGSARGVVGCSLNEIQHTGPKIQDDLISLILRFRQHKIVVAADIEKMYRMLWIAQDQRHLQVVFWRSSPDAQLQTYQLNTVTYGTTSAPFLAIRCLKELGLLHANSHPNASKVILRDFYVDDLLTGGNSAPEVLELANTVSKILLSAKLNLRKWVSNSKELLHAFKDKTQGVTFGTKTDSKMLGIHWQNEDDTLHFKLQLTDKIEKNTKRAILSGIAQVFDPLGLLSPVIILMKILLQEIWTLKLGWDDQVPLTIQNKWLQFKQDLCVLNDLSIPRWILTDNVEVIQLHGFADACETGYGANIYVRTISASNNICVNLLCAKSRVAPLKTLTIPRLELAAAVLLAELYQLVSTSMTVKFDTVHFWSDSTITLHWLSTSPNLLQTFVAHRVARIQSLTNVTDWKHVRTNDNPADIISRGVQPAQLNNDFWWHGPTWLLQNQDVWPNSVLQFTDSPPEMKRVVCVIQTRSENSVMIFSKYSSYNRLVRVTAFCLRFINNCKTSPENRKIGSLLPEEVNSADRKLILLAQLECFEMEMTQLKSGKMLSKSLHKLNPFLDTEGILRVGGRINSTAYSFMKRHPALLSSKHHFTRLIFRHNHEKYFHLGPTALLARVRDRYWPLSGRTLARKIVHDCVQCFRCNPISVSPIMAALPDHRVDVSYPFSIVGLDYSGPIQIKTKRGRGSHTCKAYLAIFVCFSTKAIHIELVTELSTNAFIAALRRFTSRRGCPAHIYSDNGKNFVGANKELSALTNLLRSQQGHIQNDLSAMGITWHFIPPYSPHFGGLWERSVRSVKHHLRRSFANTKFAFEELYTALTQIEAILNSRPLCYLSNDPNDLEPLTPSHFLIGRKMDMVPDVDVTSTPPSRLRTYQAIQLLTQLFWKRWTKEYLAELQELQKWTSSKGELKENMVVVIKDGSGQPYQWKLGRITKLYYGRDNVARVADVKTAAGTVTRSFSKLCPLPSQD